MIKKYFVVIQILTTLLQISYSFVVDCPDQSEFCECSPEEDVCEFTFRIENRQSFTAYLLNQTTRQLIHDGHQYFINSSGFYPTSKYRTTCAMKGIVNDEDFAKQNCSIPMTLDGVNYRPLILINGRIPGPTLIVTEGQIIVVHVLNYLESSGITIHWHGMFQKHTTWMDGVGFVSQPPIDVDSSFDYIFKAEPSGTHWYHSHTGSLRLYGLFGALVVREKISLGEILQDSMYNSVVDNAGEHTFTIIDWQRKEGEVHQSLGFLGFYNQLPLGQVPTDRDQQVLSDQSIDGAYLGNLPFWSGLINGKGRRSNDIPTPLSIFHVEQGKVFHFRMICSSGFFGFIVSIDGHKIKAIASDGEYFEPVEVDYIIVNVGETYDFLLEANNDEDYNFWIRANTLAEPPPVPEKSARAILTYGNSSDLDWRTSYSNVPERVHTCTADSPCSVLNCPFESYPKTFNLSCIQLTSLIRKPGSHKTDTPRFPPDPECVDCLHFLNIGNQGENGFSAVNAKSFRFPSTTYATNCYQYEREKIDSSVNTCNKRTVDVNSTNYGIQCIHVIEIANNYSYNDESEPPSVAMVISNIGELWLAHPIHLHGHSYHVMHIGYGTYDNSTWRLIGNSKDIDCVDEALCINPKWRDGIPEAVLNRPVSTAVRKNTLTIPPGGYAVIAFQANNPGYWLMHCHNERHLAAGMTVIVQEYSSKWQWAAPPGINTHRSFSWNLNEFNRRIASKEVCSSPSSMSASLAASLAINVLLMVLVLALIIALVITCCHRNGWRKITLPGWNTPPKNGGYAECKNDPLKDSNCFETSLTTISTTSEEPAPLGDLVSSEDNAIPVLQKSLSEEDKACLINTQY